MKHLVINADDFGADVYRNKGIAAAVEAGVVTSVSVLVNGPAFGDALARLPAWQDRGVSVGLHVNLSEGRPVCPGLAVLLDEHGCFRGKSSTHKMLMQKGNEELEREIAREIEAQIGLLGGKAIRISHLDGHQHVHVFPAVIAAALRAAQRHGISWLRIPEEPATLSSSAPGEKVAGGGEESPDGKNQHADFTTARESRDELEKLQSLSREGARFSQLARAARPLLKGGGVRTTDHFRGLYLKGVMSFPRLEGLLNDLPAGLTELMVHPGRAPAGPAQGPFAAFSNADRVGELSVLLDPRLHEIMQEKDIIPTPYPEIRS